jgi:ribosomal protein L19
VTRVNPERSISGTISNVSGDGLQVEMKTGKTVRVTPFPGALIRLNGKTVKMEDLQPGDTVVVLGQQVTTASPSTPRFQAHAITARRT